MRTAAWLLLISLVCFTACTNKTDTNDKATNPATTSSAANTDADNTARNANLNTSTDTAAAQAENPADREISAAIRKSVVADDTLSVNAHNVKIITSDGVVMLRGPVKSEQEKQAIESKAKQVAGVKSVTNLLEVEQKQ